ncbi:TAFII55 protein conserved region-domain-containing protein [Chlamydoabsidia padenii]|nr:TAFII55 protein conserved region-domain-containing protein [Chlamydoabsidia padenii]
MENIKIEDGEPKTPKVKVKIKRSKMPKSTNQPNKDKPIKIKLTAKEGGYSTVAGMGSEDEEEPEPTIEEHLILRLPEGEMCDKLHEYVKKREIPEDIKLNFKDNRRGYFYFDGQRHDLTLVDLPTIIESQKTLDKKQFYKIADISQMLVVDGATLDTPMTQQVNGRHQTDPYMYPHGLTPPLKYVRKRRFRKKLSKRAIEEVEREVERLLEVDATAEDVSYEVFDGREEMEMESDTGTQDIGSGRDDSDSDADMMAAIVEGLDEIDDNDDDDNDGANDDDDDDGDDEDEDEEEDSEDSDDDDDDDDDDETGQTGEIEQKQQEIDEIEQAIERKKKDVETAPNAMLKKRFETSVESLKKELALKQAHLAEMRK